MPAPSELPSGTVTFLFTDIEGSTRLLKQLGRERYGELLSRHNAHLRSVFERHGGIEVDPQGDGFFAVFRSAGSAVAAAAEAQRVLAGEQWPDAVSVRVRMGLHTGEAGAGEGVYVGMAIHLAAGVGAAAEGGQILLTSTVASIVEHELPARGHLRDLGERLLKGLERPERLYALELDDLQISVSPEPPPRVVGRRPAPLLERESDLAALRALVDAARNGDGRFAVIEGSAGMGKTRLLAEARAMGAGMGLRVLSARGGELEREFAYGIVRQLFEPLVASASADDRTELLAGAAGLAAPLFGESALAETPATGDVSFAILHGLYWLAANAAFAQPTLLLVDDLHWADAPSLRWLAHLVRRLDGLPLMLAVGTRPPQQSEQAELLTELLTDPAAVVLRPGMLTRESVAILARDVFSAEPDADFCAACLGATGGNPLYLGALLITLAVDGLAPTAESSPRVREVGPEPVGRAVSVRLSRLPQEAGALARAIAVLGRGAELGLAAALAGLDRSVAVAASAALARSELLRLEPTVEFAHPVVRAAIYEAIGPVERADAHRRAAGILAETGAEPEQIASHLLLVRPAADPFVGAVLREAARGALARGAADTSVVYLRRALAEPPAREERGDVLWELGLAESLVDVLAAADHLVEALGTVDDPLRYGQFALHCGRILFYAARNDEAIEILMEGAARVGRENRALREQLEAALINSARFEPTLYPKARQLVAGLSEQEPDRIETDVLLAMLAYDKGLRGVDRERAVVLAERALQTGFLEGSGSVALNFAPHLLGFAGDPRAIAILDEVVAAARHRGDLVNVIIGVTTRGLFKRRFGDLLAAEADAREGLSLAEQLGAPLIVLYATAGLADVLIERGQFDAAEAILTTLEVGERVPDSAHLAFAFFLNARGRIRLEQRRVEEALADFLAQGRIAEALDIQNPDPSWSWRSSAAAALHVLGQDDQARKLVVDELQRARRWGAARAIGIALHALGLIEGGAEREQLLREAVDILAPSPARLEHARALIELGAAVRRRNERTEARELLREGVDLAHGCGATPLVERANEELAATGARPRKILLTGLAPLTASERRVAQLAAEELSNKEIAQALFVTVKTVEVHLSSVYRKLEIGSRRQLPAALVAPHPSEPALAGG
jgi:class 3 adenylate cyclase/DNA-binding CsgD family transcriptional regulator